MFRTARLTTALAIVVTMGQSLAAAHEPVPESVPSFSESPGCGDLDGVRGPLAAEPGILDLDEPIYGPWADFYGRTVGLAWSQRVVIDLPNMVGTPKTLWVHERVLPALQSAIANLEEQDALGNVYEIRYDKTWSWARYTIPPGRAFSFHAVGAALDINSHTNPYRSDNVLITDMPDWFVEAWTSAGWCWGGDWQSIKDPMHYSWMGPVHTPGYTMPPPQPPLVAHASFSAEVSYSVGLAPRSSPTQRNLVIDVDRDGAVDVVRVEPDGSGMRLLVARAHHNYLWSDWFADTPTAVADTGAPVALADLSRDGRPDLVFLLDTAGTLEMQVFPMVQGGLGAPHTIPTAVAAGADSTYLFDDDDRDGYTDLYVIRPGEPATLEVWRGPAFASPETVVSLAVDSSARFALGDRDFDGRPDVFALQDDGTLTIHSANSGFTSTTVIATGIDPSGETMFAEDLDGDGHPDLMLVDDDGQLRLRRGGASTHKPGVWFVSRTHDVQRVAGANRYATAAAMSRQQHPDPSSVDTVVIATGAAFPDALAGAAFAARIGSPLLLVAPSAMPPETAAELDRLRPDEIIVLGGTSAISASVEAALEARAPVTRLAGSDRYATATEISRYAHPDGSEVVVVAAGDVFADALSAGPAASEIGGPVLLTAPDHLPPATREELTRLAPSRIVLLGGEAVVSQGVLETLQALAPTTRVAGYDRYATAVAASQLAFPGGSSRVYVATGLAFPDALAGADAGAYDGSPILLVPGSTVPASVLTEILRLRARQIVIVGGPSAVSTTVESLLEMAGF